MQPGVQRGVKPGAQAGEAAAQQTAQQTAQPAAQTASTERRRGSEASQRYSKAQPAVQQSKPKEKSSWNLPPLVPETSSSEVQLSEHSASGQAKYAASHLTVLEIFH